MKNGCVYSKNDPFEFFTHPFRIGEALPCPPTRELFQHGWLVFETWQSVKARDEYNFRIEEYRAMFCMVTDIQSSQTIHEKLSKQSKWRWFYLHHSLDWKTF